MSIRSSRPAGAVGLGVLALALTLSGCSGSSSGGGAASTPTTGQTGATTGGTAAPASDVDYKGTLRAPDTTARPGVKGKKLVILSAGQASISSSIPVNAAKEAAESLGWTVTVYDAQLNPANAAGLVRQGIASGADAMILNATDCPTVKGAMAEAKAKGIKMVGIYSFDCNDPIFGNTSDTPLFSGQINYGSEAAANIGKFTEQYGADQAKAVIAATNGKAQVVFFNDLEVTVLRYTGKGFLDEIAKCGGCKVLANVEFTGAELGPALQQKVTSTLLRYPTANAVKSPFTAATLLGIAPAVSQSGRSAKLYVMGGEGFAPELDLVRSGAGVNAVNIAPSDWTGWAAVDTLNSIFSGKPPADSGLGWQLVDKTHNIPASGPFVPPVDFRASYKKAWGVA
jgi:ribose transport system substrate-binding protein